MSFSTMNGVNAARTGGMSGTRRMPLANRIQQPEAPMQNIIGPPPGIQGPVGVAGAAAPVPQNIQRGMMGSRVNALRGMTYNQTGVAARPPAQQPLPQPAAPQFDPNDPNNAALIGYMNG